MAKATPAASPVNLDLDHYEHAKGPEAFRATVRGRTLTFNDPMDQPWDRLVDLGSDFYAFLALALDGEPRNEESDLGFFLAIQQSDKPLSTRDIRVLMESYAAHYGMDSPGNGGVSRT